jgi:hypothetical protein
LQVDRVELDPDPAADRRQVGRQLGQGAEQLVVPGNGPEQRGRQLPRPRIIDR